MISREKLISEIGKSKSKVKAREMAKDLDYLCRPCYGLSGLFGSAI